MTTTTTPPPPPRPTPPTHFLCIPLTVSPRARAQLATSLSAFRSDVCGAALGLGGGDLPPDAVRPLGTLHLTLGVMSFPVGAAAAAVEGGGGGGGDGERGLGRAREVLAGVGLSWYRRGLAAAVLYAPPVDQFGLLQAFCERVRDVFKDAELMADEGRPLLLHATVVNTVYVKGKGREGGGGRGRGSRGGRGGRGGRKRERLVFDATDIIYRYENQVWAEDIPLERVAISSPSASRGYRERSQQLPCRRDMPRTDMTSPAKRRPPVGAGPKGGSTNGPRSPPRPTRTSPNNTRNANTANITTNPSSSSTFISPPPRAALSGTSSPAPDNPRNNNNTTTATAKASPHLAPATLAAAAAAARNRSPSPSPPQKPTATATANATATAAAIATCQSALREKDVRIASLERELALMESEFHRELDKLSSAESETAAFWQAKYAALEKSVAVVQTAGGQGVGLGLGWVQNQVHSQGQVYWGMDGIVEGGVDVDTQVREIRGAWQRVRDMLEKREEEVAELKAQVWGQKEWVSESTRADGEAQTSDEVFGEGMARLGNGLQNWVLVNFRRAKLDLSSAHEDTISELARLVPMYEELASTSRIHLLQSVVSRYLVELVFGAYFIGLPTDVAAQIKQVEAFLSSTSSPESVNQWRSLTLTTIKKDASEKLEKETFKIVETVVSKVNELLDPLTNTKSTEARDQGLQALVHSAIELSRLLAVQKAVFRVEMPEILPHQCIMFNGETMEDIGGEDEDSLADREICCVIFPCIIKRGDESGGHLQYRNVISKAKVLCSPE
ncbi:hypothetical protein CHGG_10391 [Chaetomium globosum CBS 148.51]|uniref:A-kinase anchor protein 7-like phosphoesterase domain-containing protein n=1 Tax=Chaetomium globosum (strain ATCC 6205 / CBS 148.51 / DSM 1962 / NBRC 6347 / NRRL 1970) TaxID=306901 RepID=Q2GNR3_CHAGB|nr:uncharacterized protein CHGG_10391 [Chaetomium globosum CBS 148.51]EAQ83987.1 hypothetical protein CHGG_10391 [Chaetomium globosum CBS 148.51]